MNVVDVGHGWPVVLIPGIQGRWEWMRPAVDALSARCRVVTFSLAPDARRFDDLVAQVLASLDQLGIERAVVCGVSYGGLVAAAFALRHPDRVAGLALVSALPHTWTPDRRIDVYLRWPRLCAPLFCVGGLRLYHEIAAAAGSVGRAVAMALGHVGRVVSHPFNARQMARRVQWLTGVDWRGLDRIQLPTLIVTGEASLDRVVPTVLTHEYARMWPHATLTTLARTGHLGLVTRADAFAEAVSAFVDESSTIDSRRRRG